VRPATILALCAAGVAAGARAHADELERRLGGRVVAREPRPHRLVHELDLGVGVLPLDALYTGLSLGGSYSFHLDDVIALELVDFRYSANLDSGLRSRLAERYEVSPTVSPEIEWLAGTGLLFTPFFGKLAFLDDAVVHASTHLGLSAGVAHFTDGFRFQVSGGPGIRLFASDTVSTRLDVRGTVAFDEVLSVESLLQINLSVALNFGARGRAEAGPERPEEDPDAVLDTLFPESRPEPRLEAIDEEASS
jgi:outer membrane beta-barrel protein